MTVDEYRLALDSLTDDQFAEFRNRWGGVKTSRDATVSEFAYSKDRDQWEQIIVFHLRRFGLTQIRTEREKEYELAKRTADAAAASAIAAAASASLAARSVRQGWYSVVAAVLAIIVSLALKRC